MKPESERRQAARAFVERWTFRRGSEKGEDQQFWNSLLHDVLGMEDVATRVQYQLPVQTGTTTKFLDAWIPETRVLIEHKSRPSGSGLTRRLTSRGARSGGIPRRSRKPMSIA